MEVRAGEEIGRVEHAFTHVRATYRAVRCRVEAGEPRPLLYDAWAWVAPEEVGGYALPVAQQKIAALAAERTPWSG
jgi:adenine-specific DNA glycosylase